MRGWIALPLALGCAAEPPPRFSVRDGAIVDEQDRVVVLRGVNLRASHKRPPFVSEPAAEDYALLEGRYGMNAVRFLVSWAGLEPVEGTYDAAYLERIADHVALAETAGLLVIFDLHQDVYGVGFAGGNGAPAWTCDAGHYAAFEPTTPWFFNYLDPHVTACFDALWTSERRQGQLAAAWATLARRFAGHPAVIGFDPLNEPFFGSFPMETFEATHLAPFYARVVAAVRAEAPEWLAFLEPAASRNFGVPTSLPHFPFGDVVYAPHLYDAAAESDAGFSPERRAGVLEKAAALAVEAERRGMALWLGEYGGRASHPGIGPYMTAVLDGADRALAGAMLWSFDRDDGYGLLDATGAEKPALAEAIARPYPSRIAGRGATFSVEGRSATLTLDAPGDGVTELAVPARWGEATIECEGCEAWAAAGGIFARASGGAMRLTARGAE